MDITKQSKSFIVQTILLVLLMGIIGLIVMRLCGLDLLTEIVVSSVFVLVLGIVIALVWRWVAQNHKDSLPTFFTAVSGFRLLLALAVLFVYYVADNEDKMLQFFLVFMAFYVVSLTHHTIFFSSVSNRS